MLPLIEITQPNLLITEGQEDTNFFTALAKHLKLEHLQIVDSGGKTTLRKFLKAIALESGFSQVQSLAVVRDADQNPSSAFISVRDALGAADLPTPNDPYTILDKQPRVAVLILPDANSTGELEDLCLRSIENDPVMQCVAQFFSCLEEQQLAPPKKVSKAKVQVFLASRPDIDWRLGIAAQRGYWPWEHPTFSEIKDCLLDLFQ